MSKLWRREIIRDYIQFRLVILDEEDNVERVLFESKIYEPTDEFKREFSDAHYNTMMYFNSIFDFCDYDNCPPMEFQARRKSKPNDWKYLSNPIEDYYNT